MIALLDGVSVAELFGGLMLLLGGVALAVSTRYVWRASTVFRATDQTTFESADAGSFVRISRTVTYDRGDVLIAPFSDSECVTFRYQIEERCLSALYLSP